MKKEYIELLPKFRNGAKSMKEFYSLKKEEKENYIKELLLIPEEERGDVDKHILRFYNLEIMPAENFFKIPDIYEI